VQKGESMKDKSIDGLLLEHYKSIASRNHYRNEILRRFEELENKIRNHKKEKDEAVKLVRIQYDSVCDMFHKREREYEDRITDLNNALINQLETGKQKTIYINQLEKENERLKGCGNCGLSRYDNDYGLSCSYKFKKVKPNDRYCDNWQSDGLTAKDRKE
jgi:hypothetical protein